MLGAADTRAQAFVPNFALLARARHAFARAIVEVQVLTSGASMVGSAIAFASASEGVPELAISASICAGGFLAHAAADVRVEVVSVWTVIRFA